MPEPVVEPETCSCYKCTYPIYPDDWDSRVPYNNVHGKLIPCEDCGRLKTEYTDYGTKGIYRCWWCNERTAGPESD